MSQSVRVLYLVPEDREHRADFEAAIEGCALDLQAWFYGHLGGKTFGLNDPIVEVRKTPHVAAWYDANVPAFDPAPMYHTWYNALHDASMLFGTRFDHPDYVWLIYIDAPGGTCAGGAGVAIMPEPEHSIEGVIASAPDKALVRRWIGVSGHELGHAFGLPHPGDEFATALMQNGWASYPDCYLTATEAATLDHSPFFRARNPHRATAHERSIYAYPGGCFVNVRGISWEDRKVGTDTIFHFTQQVVDENYHFLLDESRGPGLWIALPKVGRGGSIFYMWQGHAAWSPVYEAVEW